ncbi:hypothetical protein GALL_502280 [mine drainage metagenome]|uniref:Uncharacterized protein n=1 Tax=mine drainage metagenome TaxID=410659 RepID=A0A1J5PA60_9ZZZZ
MDTAATQTFDQIVVALARVDNLRADIQADFTDHSQNVALGRWCVRADNKVRAAQAVKMGGVVGNKKCHVNQFADTPGRGQTGHPKSRIYRFGRGDMVRFRANTTNAIGDVGHLFGLASDTE